MAPEPVSECLAPTARPCPAYSFVSKSAHDLGVGSKYGLAKKTAPVSGTRSVAKRDMVLNDACPQITVDAETFEVKADGEVLTCDPASEVPLARSYFLF